MARPKKGGGRRATKQKKVAFRTTITPPGSAKGKKKGPTKAGGPSYTPSNQWADTWKRMTSGHFARPYGSGPAVRNPRRGG